MRCRPLPIPSRSVFSTLLLVLAGTLAPFAVARAADSDRPEVAADVVATPMTAASTAVVNVADLARRERLIPASARPPVRPLLRAEQNEEGEEEERERESELAPESLSPPPFMPFLASPSPTRSFIGLDDIPMVDSSYIVIPPDVNGAVGPTRILQVMNNNLRILDKLTGAVVTTVGINTFWAAAGASPNNYTDPRSVYDPYNNRFILISQGDLNNSTGNSMLIGISDTSDPAGSWHLYRTILYQNSTSALYDFPTLGFNKNWITVSINKFTSFGSGSGNAVLMIHYPSLLANTFTSFRVNRSDFCAAPVQTYSAVTDTEYVVVHLSGTSATYRVDMITGTGPGAPTYTAGTTRTRTGGSWSSGSGQTLPQSAPNAGTSSCGATPCKIELIDSNVRTPPVFRGGSIWYTQTVIPTGGLTHSAAQWTQVTTPTGLYVDGGRIEDPTATATNGGKWYAHPQIAVNANGDFMVGFHQFSSAQHPSAGYSIHFAGDANGSIRDAVITKAGEDYYHKDFGGGRNRWGDFTTAQVDPSDDMTLWTVDEYAKTRTGTNDGTTGANSSKWSTWWAALAPPSVTIDAGPSQNEGNSGTTAFVFTARLSYAYGLPVTVNFHTTDGTATTADGDYVALTSSVIIPAGSTTAPISIDVNGDTNCEPAETFGVVLDSANNNLTLGAQTSATATLANDETPVVTASADAGGTITPSGAVAVACGGSQQFTIAASDACHSIADVLVDGVSVGAVTTYTFNDVNAPHTISATFSVAPPSSLTSSAGPGGSISPNGSTPVACGGDLTFTITPDSCQAIADVKVDGVSIGAVASHTFTNVTAPHTIEATFASTAFTLSEVLTDESCTGVADGAIDLSVLGGVPPFTYSWSGGQTSQDLSGLGAGTYTVTVSDTAGCSTTLELTIGVVQDTIVASAGPNGSIVPNGDVSLACGTDASFTITPDPGYEIDQLTVDGGAVTPASSYQFTNVTADHTIAVTFKPTVLAVEAAPSQFALGNVVPNPTSGAMQVRFGLPRESKLRLEVIDLQGRQIATLAEGTKAAGWHWASWNGRAARGPAPTGLYFVRLTAGGQRVIQKFTLSR